jgi:PilZ domain
MDVESAGLVVGHPVTMLCDDRDMKGRVAEKRAYDGRQTAGGTLLVRLDDDAECPEDRASLLVQFNSPSGPGQVLATVTSVAARLVELRLTGDISINNRRSTVRLPVDLPCMVVVETGILRGQLTNLSLGGGLLWLPEYTLREGHQVQVRFGVGGGPAVLGGHILAAQPGVDEADASVRICWESVPGELEGRMANFINAQLREIYKVARIPA